MIERYTRKEMGAIWSQENKFRTWLEVELAVCEAWYRLGYIPQEEMETIRGKADFELQRILDIEKETKHDVIAFLSAVEEKVGSASRYIHLGCTSSDIVDTANALLLSRAGDLVSEALEGFLEELQAAAEKYKGRLQMGRTHGVHAEPTSFGLKLAGFYAEFKRHKKRLAEAREEIRVGKISGAVGTYAHLSPEMEKIACDLLGLEVDEISTQIIQRDRHANFFTALALLAGGIERLCVELRHLQRTEVLEVEEGFSAGQKGSSAMPHKKNPISAENMAGLSRLIRTNALAAMEDMALWHERDISHSSVERVIMPDSTILAHYMLHRLKNVIRNLQVNPENMDENLESSLGLFYSQRVLLALIDKGLKRQEAYEAVQAVAMRCWQNGLYFPHEVRREEKLTSYLGPEDLKEIFDPQYYLRYENTIYKRVFG